MKKKLSFWFAREKEEECRWDCLCTVLGLFVEPFFDGAKQAFHAFWLTSKTTTATTTKTTTTSAPLRFTSLS
jgi:hypothetical protein